MGNDIMGTPYGMGFVHSRFILGNATDRFSSELLARGC